MKQLTCKCNLTKERRPEWLRWIISALHTLMAQRMTGDDADFASIHSNLGQLIYQMHLTGVLKSKIAVESVTDGGETALFIRRSGRTLILIYFK